MKQRTYLAIDLKSFYASVECRERGLDPLNTNLVVADESRTDKTICLAVTPTLKSYGISGRGRLFEVRQRVREVDIHKFNPQNRETQKKFYRAGQNADRQLTPVFRAAARPCAGGGFRDRAAAHGLLYGIQYAHL